MSLNGKSMYQIGQGQLDICLRTRFRSIQWLAMVSNVLGGKEDTKGQTVQKIAARQQTGHGAHLKIGSFLQKLADILLLRNIVSAVATKLFEQGKRVLSSMKYAWVE